VKKIIKSDAFRITLQLAKENWEKNFLKGNFEKICEIIFIHENDVRKR